MNLKFKYPNSRLNKKRTHIINQKDLNTNLQITKTQTYQY